MLNSRVKRRTAFAAQAVSQLADIQASIVALNDEDLLDLADIFDAQAGSPLRELASAEMAKRNLSL